MSLEDLEDAPEGTAGRDVMDDLVQKRGGMWHQFETMPMTSVYMTRYLPVRILE
jgi:hypothetical protein